MRVVVVGAGVAGLRVASQLARDHHDVTVVERRGAVGGRMRTAYRGGRVDFEEGPWRVFEGHARVRELCDAHGLTLDPMLTSRGAQPRYTGPDDDASTTTSASPITAAGLSTFEALSLAHGMPEARARELATGYDGFMEGAAAANTYNAQRHVPGKYYVVREGFEELARRMEADLLRAGGRIRFRERVVDVVRQTGGGYEVIVLPRREGFGPEGIQCDAVVLALPPHFFADWPVARRWLRPVTASIDTLELHHIYASEAWLPRPTHLRTAEAIGQVVSGSEHGRALQVSYTGGRSARFWRRLHLSDPDTFERALRREFQRATGQSLPESARFHSRYWRHAVHVWRAEAAWDPSVSVRDLVARSVEPHRDALPGVYFASEANSDAQGWCEGALRTAEEVLRRLSVLSPTPTLPPPLLLPASWLVLDGRVLDVCRWIDRHPGSARAIRKYLGRDASRVFRHVLHTRASWAYAFAMQVGLLSDFRLTPQQPPALTNVS